MSFIKRHEIIVGNVGTVYDGSKLLEARRTYDDYCVLSEHGGGRAAGEPVIWLQDGEIAHEFPPPSPDEKLRAEYQALSARLEARAASGLQLSGTQAAMAAWAIDCLLNDKLKRPFPR